MVWRAGVIGYGLGGRVFHVPFLQAAGFEVRAVATRQADALAKDLPGAEAVTPEALIRRADIDLVVVAAPNDSHVALASAALEAGKHVVIDKPVALSAADADALAALAARVGRRAAVFQNRRWDAEFLTLRQVIADGEIGAPMSLRLRYDRFRPTVRTRWKEGAGPGAGLLWDLGPHLVDQALVLFGWPDWVQADLEIQRPGGVSDDYAELTLASGTRRVQLGIGSYAADPGPRIVLHGERGSFLKYGGDVQEVQIQAGMKPDHPDFGVEPPGRAGVVTVMTEDGPSHRPVATLPGRYVEFYTRMAAALAGDGPVPVTLAEGRDVVRIIELARRSHTEGRRVEASRLSE